MENFKPYANFSTDAIHEGQSPDQWNSGAVIPPISLSTTFKQPAPGEPPQFDYARSGNPTRDCLERCLAKLENCKYGLTYSSGCACTMTILHLLKAGDHVISMDDLYGGTNRYFRHVASRFGVEFSFVDATDVNHVEKAMKPNTTMVWIETPTNPTMKIVDIQAVCDLVHRTKPECLVVVDNTFMSSYFQRPSDLGADIAYHSLTKYMNGHSDVVMGALMTNRQDLYDRLKYLQNAIGAVPSPFDCFLVNRGLKTLAVRMRAHQTSGLAVAKFLETHPLVTKVIHPGLKSHPQYDLARKQMRGFSGMTTFYMKGGIGESTKFLQSLKVFALAESLGGFESLAELPSVMTHASVHADERQVLGITDNMIRLSIGLEETEDLINDLDQALKASH